MGVVPIFMGSQDEHVIRRLLEEHQADVDRLRSQFFSLVSSLRGMNLEGWRQEGSDLVAWMEMEADDMAEAEKNVAISKVSGGSAAIAGGVMTGVGIVASFFTFGIAAPLAVAGLSLGAAGIATTTGGDIAQLSIKHMKTCEIKRRCESFEKRSEKIVSVLVQFRVVMTELSDLCMQYSLDAESSVPQILVKSGASFAKCVKAGVDIFKVTRIVKGLAMLEGKGIIFGADLVRAAVGNMKGPSRIVSKAMFKGVGAVVGIGFGIWDVVEASGTLRDGGSHTKLIRQNAALLKTTVTEIDNALKRLLEAN